MTEHFFAIRTDDLCTIDFFKLKSEQKCFICPHKYLAHSFLLHRKICNYTFIFLVRYDCAILRLKTNQI